MKICRACGLTKTLDNFYTYAGGRPYLDCKPCEVIKATERRQSNLAAYSRQRRIRQSCPKRKAIAREYRQAHKERRAKLINEWAKRNRHKCNAHHKVFRALEKGKLIRPDSCSSCGKKCKPSAHHEDYSKVLEVIWLCRICHGGLHRISY